MLSIEEYTKYFDRTKEAKARYTDYSRRLTEEYYFATIREPYGFWWLKTQGNNTDFVCHICNNGTVNRYMRAAALDGLRPIMRIRIE